MEPAMEKLDIRSTPEAIEDYLERFEIWSMTKKDVKGEKIVAHFLTFIGREAYSLLKTLAYPEKPISLPYATLKELLLSHVKCTSFECRERAKFHKMVRQNDQKVREFILELQKQAAKCNFGDQLHVQLRDRLIAGINIPSLERELLRMPNCSFQDARTACINYEAVNELDIQSMKISNTLLSRRDELQSQGQSNLRSFNSDSYSRVNMKGVSTRNYKANHKGEMKFGKCLSCGKFHARNSCVFRNAKCFKCGKVGHIQSVCKATVHFASSCTKSCNLNFNNSDVSSDHLSLSTISKGNAHIQKRLYTSLGSFHDFILDTGSIESIISFKNLKSLDPNVVVRPTEVSILGITGHRLPIRGCCELLIRDDNSSYIPCEFLVSETGLSILGLKNLKRLKVELSFLVSKENSDTLLKDLIAMCAKCSGGMKIKPIKLQVQGDPVFLKRRIIPYGLREAVRKTLNDLCVKGIIEPIQSSAWGTPIVTPLKSDGKTPRICGDYRLTLNSRLLKQTCTTVEAEDILNRLHGSKVFSKVDLKDAYLQIPLDESSSILTTINTPFGLFKYNFLPFGLSCSPAIFQEVMNNVVSDLEGVEVYQDDLIVHGSNKVVHDQRLIALLRRLIEKNITVNPNKCSFCVSSFECLGYLVDGNGFRPDMKRLAPLTNAPSPKNLTELRSLVGALQYYSRFIPNFSCRANCLFNILTSNSFKWSEEQESCLRSLLKFLQSDAVLRTYSPNVHSVLITDASPVGIGAVLEQEGRPVICVSQKLTVTEQGYSQTQREALAVFWAVKRLHKYLFGKKFTIVTDHEALKFIYHPEKSLARSSAAMVQRWSIALSAYDYTVQHRSAKQIQHVDYISRQSLQDKPIITSDCLLVQPLPVRRSDLIRETRRYFGCILSAIRKGWNANLKRRFPIYFSKRDELSTTPDGILCLNDRVVIPPSLRKSVLEDLHSGHLGVEKMKSLARLTCWWPEINADICRTANNCEKCRQLKSHPSKWVPWPVSSEAWQRIHADYCGPFLGKYYALVVIDSFSKWPEVFFTTSPNSDFTIQALRKVFSREGVPLVLVTDNGSHFAADAVTTWLNGIGCKHLFTAPRHPCSNGQAENFVRTLKTAIDSIAPSTFNELERGVDTFLLQYRNAKHSVTKETPAKLLKGRILRSNMRCLESAEVTYYRGNDLRPSTGIVLKNVGKSMVRILDIDDLSTHSRHVDQIQFQEPGESVPISIVNSNANEHILDNTESLSNTMSDRLRMNLRRRRTIDYKHLDSNLSCGGCGV
ncbi:unnamed protein product [Schistosoma intercalatum]|nr:unnamed protein product [Schistosoma intercalatum]